MRNLKLTTPKTCGLAALATAFVTIAASVAQAQYTAVWYDGYATSANSSDVNFEYATRQGGVLGAISYAQSPAAGDFHHQVGNVPNKLLLAGDWGSLGMVSPNYNFNGLVGGGTPARVFFQMQMNVFALATYTTAGFSLGSSSTLTGAQDATNHFGIRFTRDALFGGGNVMQFFDGATQVGPNYAFPGGIDPGAGSFDVALNISDDSDGNPWNGVGSTDISVYVNGSLVGSYSKGGGGYTNNFMTLESGFGATGSAGSPVIGLAVNVFDELTVFTTLVPEYWAIGNGVWDINTTANWKIAGVAGNNYQEGASVIVDDTASGASPINLTLNATVNPASFTANLTNKNYTIGGSGAIAGAAALTKNGAGTLTLSNANTYTGNTIINAGTLALKGTGSITNSPSITLAANATFNVSGLTIPPFVLGSGRALIASGTNGTLNGSINLNAGSALTLTYTLGKPTLTVVSGALNFNPNAAVTINVSGTPLPVGSYKLIGTNSGGSITGTLPTTVALTGAGSVSDTASSLAVLSGALYLNVVALNNNPTLTGLLLWLKPDGLTNSANLSPVSFWTNSVGTGNPATNGIAASQPIYLANGLNGYPVVRFKDDGNTNLHWLVSSLPNSANSNSFTAIVMFESQITGQRDTVLGQRGGNGQSLIYVQTNSAPSLNPNISSSASGKNLPVPQAYAVGNWTVLALVQNAAAGTVTLYQNGSVVTNTTIGNISALANAGWVLGCNNSLLGDGLNGDVAEVMVYGSALNALDLGSTTLYLQQKYGFSVLADNYNTPDTLNLDENLSTRQSGSDAPTGYWWQSAQIISNQVQLQLTTSTFVFETISPNVNFITNESGNFSFSYDINSFTTNTSGNVFRTWAGLVIRGNVFGQLPETSPGFSSRIFGDGGSQEYINGGYVSGVANRGLTLPFHVNLSVVNNVLTYTINGTLVGVYNLPATGNNLISLSLAGDENVTAAFDNFAFSAIPVAPEILPEYPATVVLVDDFNTADSANINATVAVRQTGLAAPATYLTNGTVNTAVSITGNSLQLDLSPAGTEAHGLVSPFVDFWPYEVLNSFRLSFTASGANDAAAFDSWVGVRFCAANSPEPVNAPVGSGMGLIIYPANGVWVMFDKNLQVADGVVPISSSYAFEIQVVTNLLRIQINGQSLALGAGNAYLLSPVQVANYVTLQSYADASVTTGVARFDDLRFELLDVGVPTPLPANIYISSSSGSDLNSGGSSAQPWATFKNLTGVPVPPGTTIQLKRGDTWHNSLLSIIGKGTSINPITLTAYGEGSMPVITGRNLTNAPCIQWENPSHIRINSLQCQDAKVGLYLRYTGGNELGTGPMFANSDVQVTSCHFQNMNAYWSDTNGYISVKPPYELSWGAGIWIGGHIPQLTTNLTPSITSVILDGFSATHCGFQGVSTGIGDNYYFVFGGSRNRFPNLYYADSWSTGTDNGVFALFYASGRIERVETYSGWTNLIMSGTSAAFIQACTNLTITDSEFAGNLRTVPSGDGLGMDYEGYNVSCSFSNNVIHDNEGEGFLMLNSGGPNLGFVINNNTFWNDNRDPASTQNFELFSSGSGFTGSFSNNGVYLGAANAFGSPAVNNDPSTWNAFAGYSSTRTATPYLSVSGRPLAWNFVSSVEGWSGANQWSGFGASGGALVGTSTGTDPFVLSPATWVNTREYRWVHVRMSQTAGISAQIFFQLETDPTFTVAKSATFPIIADGVMRDYIVDVGPAQNCHGVVTQWRLDPTGTAGSVMAIDVFEAVNNPYLASVTPVSASSLKVSFNQAMLPAGGVFTPANFTLSGSGQGSAAAHPDTVSLIATTNGPVYQLNWLTGSMNNTVTANLAVVNAQNSRGIPMWSGSQTGSQVGFTNSFGQAVATKPVISSITLVGNNLVMSGQNGLAGLTYTTVMSTNVALPLVQWTPVATNVLAVSGNFTITATNAVSPGARQQFYTLKVQ